MSLEEYFKNTTGTGVLATSDAEGRVDVAVYAKPHFIDGSLAFIMNDRLSHHNLQSNFHAAFLFKEDSGHRGKRLFLKKTREEQDTELLHSIRRREYPGDSDAELPPKFLVFFEVTKELPLIGGGDK
jgi:hypothetical protein